MGIIRFSAWSAFFGIVIPLIFQVIWWLVDRFGIGDLNVQLVIQKVMLILWPTSLMILPAGGDESLLATLLLMSMAVNSVLYLIVGSAIWYGLRKHRLVLVIVAITISVLWWRVLTL